MQQEKSGKGAWTAFALALILAIVFLVMWHMRGSEIDSLSASLRSNEQSAAAESRRLAGELETASADLAAASRRVEELESRLRDEQRRAAESTQQTEQRLRAEIDSAAGQLAQLRATAQAAAAASATENAELRRQLEAANGRLTESKTAAADLERKIGDLEASLSAIRQEHETTRQNLDKALSAIRENAEAAKASAVTANVQQELTSRISALEAEAADLRGKNALLDAQRDSLQSRLEVAAVAGRRRLENLRGELRATEQKLAAAEKAAADRIRQLLGQLEQERAERQNRDGAPQPPVSSAPVVTGDPGRFAGRIIEKSSDGNVFFIDGGRNQRIQPGMKFDVHRITDGKRQYIGMVRVSRTLDDHSVAVPANPDAATVCPATGRAVLDPDTRVSPYARAADGAPLPLITAAGGLHPDVGDYIDNPFYYPDAARLIAISPDLPHAETIVRVVRGMGNTPCLNTGDLAGVEILLVKKAGDWLPGDAQPRQEGVGKLLNYWH